MAVVINDMEVAPQPDASAPPEGQQQNTGAGSKDETAQVEKKLHLKRARMHRLEAY